ncbi:hypothetical protein DSO57_1005207 [Entomophthora muscae]|uniref:Uncharacterized protein n=1 Tax=Entomophthora muscae TaxID=34485 RepID=A0ACC2T864_9FUNG|nr:hypothetical protein DSO57_1005207 [Entomophthora muscae]
MTKFNHRRILVVLNYVLNSASIIGGILTAAIILGTICFDRKVMNRVSLRFTLAVAIVDVAKAAAILAITKIHEDSTMCTLVALLTHWLTLVYLLLNTCVVLNLQLILVHGWVPGKKFEQSLWAVALLIPTILMSIGQGK